MDGRTNQNFPFCRLSGRLSFFLGSCKMAAAGPALTTTCTFFSSDLTECPVTGETEVLYILLLLDGVSNITMDRRTAGPRSTWRLLTGQSAWGALYCIGRPGIWGWNGMPIRLLQACVYDIQRSTLVFERALPQDAVDEI
jgi:hypothetical protein